MPLLGRPLGSALLFCGTLAAGPAPPAADGAPAALPQGMERMTFVHAAERPADRTQVNVLVLDPARVRLVVARAMDELVGAETTSSLAARHGAAAATNGGFFRTTGLCRGEPEGALVLGGKLLSEPSFGRPALALAFGVRGTQVAIGHLRVTASLRLGVSGPVPVAGLNRPRGADELLVFGPEFHRTTLTPPDGLEAVVEDGRVTTVRDRAGSTPIPRNGFVVSAAGHAREQLLGTLVPGMTAALNVTTAFEPPVPFEPEWVVGGGPLLLRDGQPVPAPPEERYGAGFLTERHPRTAAGLRKDGAFLLVAVDGRRPGTSAGMTIAELAQLVKDLGCVEALNLDGGGSTTMVVSGVVVNSPSDAAGERPVSDALLVFPRPAAPGATGR